MTADRVMAASYHQGAQMCQSYRDYSRLWGVYHSFHGMRGGGMNNASLPFLGRDLNRLTSFKLADQRHE